MYTAIALYNLLQLYYDGIPVFYCKLSESSFGVVSENDSWYFVVYQNGREIWRTPHGKLTPTKYEDIFGVIEMYSQRNKIYVE